MIPHIITVFAWLVALEGVNTCDVLQKKRSYSAFSPSWCVPCKREGESVDHLFIHCSFSLNIWWKALQVFGLSWVAHGSCYGLLSRQTGFIKGKDKKKKIIWNHILFAILWAIWG